jgi:DNA-binding CsgD family transcriptional regulator
VATVVDDANLLRPERLIELGRLNQAERRVLRLLAEGHTVKTIATALDSTPGAVNERLREARRKTGVGSSRELARMLKAQENRHEQVGVGSAASARAQPWQLDAEPWRPHTGVLVMIALFLAAAAGAAALMSEAQPAPGEVDPLIGTPLKSGPDPAMLHAKVRAEPRDASWVSKIEGAVRERLLQIPLIGKDGNALRVTCATNLCELAGTIRWPYPPSKEYDPKLPESRAQSALQDKALHDDLAKLGLKQEAGLFTGAQGKPERIVFLLYYSRAAATTK